MKLTTKGRYAVLALTELALAKENSLVKITEIAVRQNISSTYLEQILLLLKNSDLIIGVRGPNGGYKLSTSPENIMISDIVNIVEGRMEAKGCVSKSGSCTGVSGRCLTHDLWDELSRHIELFLGQISLKDIIAGNVLGRSSPPKVLELK
ncbi:Rrf2 family transcriptional regulator [Hyphomicrobiales bacterium]|jgi:Rrf2 family iron-sulfur cluster assembly transcriptional regulator|nr:Rrf2 family transcriptional regulator [Alphaproteobacteria bacterium]MDC0474206.1 Rrf2 family transcriptional regulator [Hyphomicrobiales bacterium]MBT4911691.1 Rrf2 family transcriptional regulator [Alphaproteobacteria bacterium]MBT5663554.1 Rrf2 family transcriptional regulator [Alphaproteobacteria bacterium]MDG1152314.1 Rrf2 family transcriptional regulator [Hyphomicrobiales bacterium]|tara:strand:+ start:1451 stop:1900 length:450 start_codon:yes stop_codon:yes gene_type:complete